MKTLLIIIFSLPCFSSFALEPKDNRLIDGSWVRYKYETYGESRFEFLDGKVMWQWLDESNKKEATRDQRLSEDEKLQTIPYRVK